MRNISFLKTHPKKKKSFHIPSYVNNRFIQYIHFQKMVFTNHTINLIFITLLFFLLVSMLTTSTIRYVPYSDVPHYASYSEGMTLSPTLIVPEQTKEQVYTVPSFQGMYTAPGISTMIDPLGSLKGDKQCSPDSNLTTNNGFVCLPNTIKESLISRGGNA
jgi:hypothetical protein